MAINFRYFYKQLQNDILVVFANFKSNIILTLTKLKKEPESLWLIVKSYMPSRLNLKV
jgi:hypothetical protein